MKIFISYSSKNRALVESLMNDLQALGHEPWFDKELLGGQVWWDQILDKIRDCDLCILALTPQSLDSIPCRLEYTYAAAANKRILPAILDSVDTSVLPSALAAIQFVDYRQTDRPSEIINLSRALSKLPPPKAPPIPWPAPPPTPLSPLAYLRDQIEADGLSFQQQASLVFELKALLEHPGTAVGARQLLTRLRNRNDLFEQPAHELDMLLIPIPPQPAMLVVQAYNQNRSVLAMRALLAAGVAILVLVVALVAFSRALRPANMTTSIRTFTGHTDRVNSVAFSPDGKYVVTGSDDESARLWDVLSSGPSTLIQTVNGKIGSVLNVAFFPDEFSPVFSVAFSPDGKYVLLGRGGGTAQLWDVHNRQSMSIKRIFTGHIGRVTCVAFSPDGNYVLTGSSDNTAQLWDVQRVMSSAIVVDGHTEGVNSVAFSPDGNYVLTGSSDNTAQLWDVQNMKSIRTLLGLTSPVNSVAFSPDGKFLLTGSNNVQLWDAQSGQSIRIFAGNMKQVNSVAFSPDGKYVLAGGADYTAWLWDVQNVKSIRTFTGHTATVNSVGFSPDGKYVITASTDDTARLWESGIGG